MIKAHKIRLHPTPEQANYFARAAGTARFTFNWAVAEWQKQYEAGGKPSALALRTQFNEIKREQFPWVYEVTKCAVEGAFMDVAAAFKNFFEGRKAGRKTGYPRIQEQEAFSAILLSFKRQIHGGRPTSSTCQSWDG
jgi:putative transposase